ncbi:C2H2-type domain-containing protein [Microbotryomycetes sp. JL201]|nr:C2H2-type domain-containing protein [Microbotryomycetes sp. JL201]
MAATDGDIDPTLESFDIPVNGAAPSSAESATATGSQPAVGQVQPAPFAVAPSAAAKAAQQQHFQHQPVQANGQSSLEDDLNWAMLDPSAAVADGSAPHHLDDLPVDATSSSVSQEPLQQQQPQQHAQLLDQLTSAAASISRNTNDIPVSSAQGNDVVPAPRPGPKTAAAKRKRRKEEDTSDDDYPADWVPQPTELSEAGRPIRQSASRWTAEEDDQLIEFVKVSPPLSWTEIGEKLGKRGQVAGQRWYNVLKEREENKGIERVEPGGGKPPKGMVIRDEVSDDDDYIMELQEDLSVQPTDTNQAPKQRRNLRRWKGEDDDKLKELVEKYADKLDESWEKIAEEIGHDRSWRACRERYNKTIKPPTEGDDDEPFDELLDEDNILVDDVVGEEDEEYKGGDEGEGDAEYDEKKPAAVRTRKPTTNRLKGHFTPAGQSPMFLADEALVEHPPIPFTPQSVIRGRRTLAADALLNKISAPGKSKKVHACPAQHCKAAFKRSEHLKRHYKSVHMGSKPFPCMEEGCTKAFSRKDNLQQHMAMVHSKKAIKLDHPENGITHRYEPMSPAETNSKRRTAPRKSAAAIDTSDGGSVGVGSPLVSHSVSGDINPDLMDDVGDSAVHAAVAASTSANTGLDTSAAGGAADSTNFFETVEGMGYDPQLAALSAGDNGLAGHSDVQAHDQAQSGSLSVTQKQRVKRRRLNKDTDGIESSGESMNPSGDIQVDVMPGVELGDGVYTNDV